MTDPVLAARLDALGRDLDKVINSDWLQVLGLGKDGVNDSDVWVGFQTTLGLAARKQRSRVTELSEALKTTSADSDVSHLWRQYQEASSLSEALFPEFLEFIGAMAFRDRGIDDRICRIADELVRKCSKDTIGDPWQSMTVPSRPEAVTKTMARIVRLRFPEHPPIWALPLSAHSFGHVIMREKQALNSFVAGQVAGWSSGLPLRKIKRSQAEAHVRELAVDAFSTYYMGPAYACAVHYLRFDPLAVERKGDDRVSPLSRSYVILHMLRMMNDSVQSRPFARALEVIEESWQNVRSRAGATAMLDNSDKERLARLVGDAWSNFDIQFIATARYSAEGWRRAQDWMQHWYDQLDNQQALTVPSDATPFSSLRDALNAAWLLRILRPAQEETPQITQAALDLCTVIASR